MLCNLPYVTVSQQTIWNVTLYTEVMSVRTGKRDVNANTSTVKMAQ
jgi:hypothetical protein